MKVLIIGNRNHQFIGNYVLELRKKFSDFSCDIVSYEYDDNSCRYDMVYDKIHNLEVPNLFRWNKYLRLLYQQVKFRKLLRITENYDIVHVHYIENFIVRDLHYFCKHIKAKLVVSVWGSDFLRQSVRIRSRLRTLFKRADAITIANNKIISEFVDFYKDEKIKNKIHKCLFGLRPLDILEANMSLRDEVLKNIVIGYNASEGQQHEKILNNISDLECLADYSIILPMTYPHNPLYIKRIALLAEEKKMSIEIIDRYLTDKQIAELRLNASIFIQLQVTDLLSGSMIEHLYAGAIVITGSWLPYEVLKEQGLFFIQIDSINDLRSTLEQIINGMQEYVSRAKHNKELIDGLYTWNKVISQWVNLYKAL